MNNVIFSQVPPSSGDVLWAVRNNDGSVDIKIFNNGWKSVKEVIDTDDKEIETLTKEVKDLKNQVSKLTDVVSKLTTTKSSSK